MQEVLKLINGTVFSDLNQSKGLSATYVTTEISLKELKYKNIKEMQTMKPDQHMTYIMMSITGLTERDLDELSSDDAAELIGIVHKITAKHVELGKNVLSMLGVTEDKIQLLKDSLSKSIA
jgi:hypothetical protein